MGTITSSIAVTTALGFTALAAVAACSASGGETSTRVGAGGNGNNTGGSSGSINPAGGAPGSGGSGINPMGGAGGGIPGGCGGDIYRAEARELDMYIMMDRSGSMLLFNLWNPIGQALGTFVTLPEAAGIGVGIQFFGIQDDSCDANVYAQPAAGIGLLPGNAPAVQQAIVSNAPLFGETPTLPALTGAIQYASGWAQQNPAKKVIVVLATDGSPNGCNSDLNNVSQVAQDGLNGTPSIPTYVIGIGNIAGLNQIAAAGGTGQALLVDADPQIASQQFVAAMNAIRGSALPCDYAIPSGATPDKVNLSFDGGGGPEFVPNVGDASRCDPATGGWYYDNPAAPQRILTCAGTCNHFKSVTNAQVNVVLGCDIVVK